MSSKVSFLEQCPQAQTVYIYLHTFLLSGMQPWNIFIFNYFPGQLGVATLTSSFAQRWHICVLFDLQPRRCWSITPRQLLNILQMFIKESIVVQFFFVKPGSGELWRFELKYVLQTVSALLCSVHFGRKKNCVLALTLALLCLASNWCLDKSFLTIRGRIFPNI